MQSNEWVKSFPGAVTVCDREGIILEMNEKAVQSYAADGGAKLIGSNAFDCHPVGAAQKLREMMDQQKLNIYTIEKKGVKKLIYQSPWYLDGEYAGFMELSLEIPFEMPHFVRQG